MGENFCEFRESEASHENFLHEIECSRCGQLGLPFSNSQKFSLRNLTLKQFFSLENFLLYGMCMHDCVNCRECLSLQCVLFIDEEEEEEEEEEGGGMKIQDMTESSVLSLRRTIYLTIMSR